MPDKTLENSDISGDHQNVPDIKVFGNTDSWQLLCKASSEAEGWMKSTKAYPIENLGCLVQVTTQQRNEDGSYAVAEAVTWVPGVMINAIVEPDEVTGAVLPRNKVVGRELVPIQKLTIKSLDRSAPGFAEAATAAISKRRPKVGDPCYYFAYGTPGGEFPAGVARAAIITEVEDPDNPDSAVSLVVLNPTGLFFNRGIRHSYYNEPGCWSFSNL